MVSPGYDSSYYISTICFFSFNTLTPVANVCGISLVDPSLSYCRSSMLWQYLIAHCLIIVHDFLQLTRKPHSPIGNYVIIPLSVFLQLTFCFLGMLISLLDDYVDCTQILKSSLGGTVCLLSYPKYTTVLMQLYVHFLRFLWKLSNTLWQTLSISTIWHISKAILLLKTSSLCLRIL